MFVTVLTTMVAYLLIGVIVLILLRVLERWFPDLRYGFDRPLDSGERMLAYVLWPFLVVVSVWELLTVPDGPNLWGRIEDSIVDILSPKKKDETNGNQ